ncbi:PREDICTED: uncharacterized protein LOC109234158 isoform X2 [Nicotiana attenuata]|uniref:uncharacterized protein LOC109234158 isoform X2 n=1 Tax=Nicotiana attenuata TaxID=49451 RepID=UPI00090566C1|nr:PREDICTED: uncharacterized protein LOC109234158 isoform X2 [Nicotiana attenuata]
MPRGFYRMRLNCFSDSKFFSSSTPLAPVPLPSPKETHLWYVIPNEVKGESLLNKYMEILSPCEKEHVFSMRGDEPRKSALLARTLVRTTIARYQINSSIQPRSLKFRKSIHGKPEVDWQHCDHCEPPPLHFNISHTSSLIACGVTIDSPEAYVKALGRGFSGAPFKTFTVRFGSAIGESPHLSRDSNTEASEISVDMFDDPSDLTSNWQFMLLELAGSHYAAICTEKDVTSEGNNNGPMKLTVWKTIPFVEDKCVSGTEAVRVLCGFR